jgi:hypothetical protein
MARHLDEARNATLLVLRGMLEREAALERALLIEDLVGRLKVVAWMTAGDASVARDRLNAEIRPAAEPFWSGDIWIAESTSTAERAVYETAWTEGTEVTPRLRVADRHRNRGAWFQPTTEPIWSAPEAGSPIVVFYSFKGGVGRSTALAAFAIQRARAGERVAVVDCDLSAPGVGSLLGADRAGATARWGVVDYLLERPLGDVDLSDYYHACRRPEVTGDGEVVVIPAGRVDGEYLRKLARVDFELPAIPGMEHPLRVLFREVWETLRPNWLLIDARTGLSEPGGLLLSGLAHLHVLFGTSSDQSWRGLRLVLERLGAGRVLRNQPQLECLLVQAMVPSTASEGAAARSDFAERARVEFTDAYYAPDPQDPDRDDLWYVRDLEVEDAPHVPMALDYAPKLAHFEAIDDVADFLAESPDHRALADRVRDRFVVYESNGDA